MVGATKARTKGTQQSMGEIVVASIGVVTAEVVRNGRILDNCAQGHTESKVVAECIH